MINGLACYTCTNCNDPFNSNYVQVSYYNDTIPYYCTVSLNNLFRFKEISCELNRKHQLDLLHLEV